MKLLMLWSLCWGVSSALTWQQQYDAWAANLKPGYEIETQIIGSQRCHCKVPMTSSSLLIDQNSYQQSSSFNPFGIGNNNFHNNSRTTHTPVTTTTIPVITTAPIPATTTTTPTTTTTTPTTTITTPTTTTTTPTTTQTTTTTTPTTTTTTPTTTTTTPTATTTTTTPTTTTTTPTTTTTTTTPTTTTTTTTPTTTTTTPTTTTTTTTTPTTTTTTTPTTTTTTPTTTIATTTTAEPIDCTEEVIISHNSVNYWSTPNYPNNYPEDIVCTLTVTVPASITYSMAVITVAEPSRVFGSGNCIRSPDRLVVHEVHNIYYCGDITADWSLMSFGEGKKSMTFTFISSSTDGGRTAKGIKLEVRGYDAALG